MTSKAAEIERVVALRHRDPHTVLGRHLVNGRVVFRVFRPDADALAIERTGARQPMERVHPAGLFALFAGDASLPPPGAYHVVCEGSFGSERYHDPYAFSPSLGELDLHLSGEGQHLELHRVLGAHARTHQGVAGTSFSVWAPAAQSVSVVGDFNRWEPATHAMRRLGPGIWELFIPGVGPGALYKFAVHGASGGLVLKADPLGRAMELRPSNASRVTVSTHRWNDEAWMEKRARFVAPVSAVSIYEVHLGSWRQHDRTGPDRPGWLSYDELADQLCAYVADMGFTHVELMPVAEHPFDGSWGYQVGGYFAPTRRHGDPDGFRRFVERCHAHEIGVIVDWVPAHFPKDAFALGRFDGTALYEHLDPRKGEHRQWGTYMFNYGRNEVRNFLIANALYWLEELHVDGLRVDAVASMLFLDYAADHPGQWVPNEHGGRENLEAIAFLRELNDQVHARCPGCIVVAEESTAWPGVTHPTAAGGLGFDLKWNMGWMHDTLDYFEKDPIHRSFHHNRLTFGLMYAFSERFLLPLSHDEVVHLKKSLLSKMAGDKWQMFANLRALYAHMWAHPGKKLLFMGGELGEWREWSETRSLAWELLDDPAHAGVQRLVRDMNRLYRAHPAMWRADHHPASFRWIDANDNRQSVIAYLRFDPDDRDNYVVLVANLTPVPRHGYRVGVPRAVRHDEILNSDARDYGGSGMGNLGAVEASAAPSHGLPASLVLTLPPLAALWLVPARPSP